MKLRIFIVIVAVMVAWVAGRSIKSGGQSIVRSVQHDTHDAHEGDAPPAPPAPNAPDAPDAPASGGSERRIDESYELADGASVEVHGINGPVTVEAIDGNTAEVHITSTASSMSDLNDARITVEHTEKSLVVRGKGNYGGSFWKWLRGGSSEVRHNVLLKLPRHVELATSGTNGNVRIGEMEGAVEVSGINGRVELGGAHGFAEISGVNGGVVVTVIELNDKGLQVNGINGGVEIRVGRDVNADVELEGVNGYMKVEAPNVEVKEQKRNRLRARIGTGGANIEAHGINGGVRLVGV
ncbi:MAG TPA: hypothetical protein VF656_19695 [Pyrinomonadaceae bacterium]|jgi:hypothetical protein